MSDAVSVLRQVWLEATGAAYADEEYHEAAVAEFERQIARVKAEAWDEGNRWGFERHCNDQENCWDETGAPGDNPYREEESND